MQNDAGDFVDLYLPRKCSITNRIIGAKDHASTHLTFALLNEEGIYTGQNKSYALSGFLRANSEADDGLNNILARDAIIGKF